MAEIELKFVTPRHTVNAFADNVIPALTQLGMQVAKARHMQLQNDYYDTPEHDFQKNKIGFRVRGNDGVFEQTLKTQGKVSGGLHERAEYNIDLDSSHPDLTLFDQHVWPAKFDARAANAKLERQFSTNFTRTAYDVSFDGSLIEVVLDEGEATTGKAQSPINEIELEVKKGGVSALFAIAEVINSILPVTVSDVSKAAQGYQLLNGVKAQVAPMPDFLPLPSQVSTEKAFTIAAQHALTHWQHHEHLYLQTGSVKMLGEVARSIRLLLQCVSLYLPVLQCSQLLELHSLLMKYTPQWLWQDDLQSLRYLASRKSLFHKCLSRHPSLQSYVQGRKAGLVQAHDPEGLFYSTQSTEIKLRVTQLLHELPWRSEANHYAMPAIEHARGWLSQGWQTVQQSMSTTRSMGAANYTAIEIILRQTLWSGFLLADLFSGEREAFRAPWLDILTGIEELKALMMLDSIIEDTEPEEASKLNHWVAQKTHSLLTVMERTRQMGMQGDTYW
ncbi:inorganic triphosphatase [Alteromonas lipotrueiana]|uniref:CYTH domain-containing protein n=1 Tax=Alteromonas lipotrueiana TaxID=2803815 RepID=UPI001C45F081|nr:CYTH domain-containing protein [Alteromonas lipotrueiana]